MKTVHKTIKQIIKNPTDCPLPLKVIPDNMGINLCNVDSISWQRQSDGQLTNVSIHFFSEQRFSVTYMASEDLEEFEVVIKFTLPPDYETIDYLTFHEDFEHLGNEFKISSKTVPYYFCANRLARQCTKYLKQRGFKNLKK